MTHLLKTYLEGGFIVPCGKGDLDATIRHHKVEKTADKEGNMRFRMVMDARVINLLLPSKKFTLPHAFSILFY
jgi:hypothetical protein